MEVRMLRDACHFERVLLSRAKPMSASTWTLRAIAVVCSMLLTATAWADLLFTVNSAADGPDYDLLDGKCETAPAAGKTCTLRAAVMQANRVIGTDVTIELKAGLYILGPALNTDGEDSGDLNLIAPTSGNPVITIAGKGSDTTIIDGNTTDRIIAVDAGRTVVISGVTLRNGKVAVSGRGGGILNRGVLTLSNVVLSDNYASDFGGGVYNAYAQLGIYDSTITSNSTQGVGGGISSFAGGLTIVRSTIAMNEAYDAAGIDNSSVCVIVNSTISGNKAQAGAGGFNNNITVDFYNSTIVFNETNMGGTGDSGAGVFNNVLGSPGATVNLHNSIVAGNVDRYPYTAPSASDCFGPLNSYGRNAFFTVNNCQITQVGAGGPGQIVSLSELGPLRDNGGPTKTHALVPPSDLIDGTEPTVECTNLNGPLVIDQRGKPRVAGARCDIGSFEYDPNQIFFNGFE